MRKNRKKTIQHTYGLYLQLKKKNQLKSQSTFRETEKINSIVNSVSFGRIVFHTIHSQIYLFWLSNCRSNLKQQFFGVAYITQMSLSTFCEYLNMFFCLQKS
jgi:hypothetical protein